MPVRMTSSRALRAAAVFTALATGSIALTVPAGADPTDVTPLVFGVEQVRPAPAPGGDDYSLGNLTNRWWQTIAVRPTTANDNLSVYTDADRTVRLASSTQKSSNIDFVSVYSSAYNPLHAVVSRKSGAGKYTIEADKYGTIGEGTIFLQATKNDVVRSFTALTGTGGTLTVTVDPVSASLDPSIFVMTTNGSEYRPRSSAIAGAHRKGPGKIERLEVPAGPAYGVVVVFEEGRGDYELTVTRS